MRSEAARARTSVDEEHRRSRVADKRAAGGANPLDTPARRDADDDYRGVGHRFEKRGGVGFGEHRCGIDLDQSLHGERRIG